MTNAHNPIVPAMDGLEAAITALHGPGVAEAIAPGSAPAIRAGLMVAHLTGKDPKDTRTIGNQVHAMRDLALEHCPSEQVMAALRQHQLAERVGVLGALVPDAVVAKSGNARPKISSTPRPVTNTTTSPASAKRLKGLALAVRAHRGDKVEREKPAAEPLHGLEAAVACHRKEQEASQ